MFGIQGCEGGHNAKDNLDETGLVLVRNGEVVDSFFGKALAVPEATKD